MVEYFGLYGFISQRQFGFKKKTSTEDAMVVLHQFAIDALEKKLIPMIIMLDLQKAFDTIYRPRLLAKLEMIGIQGSNLKLLKSFLSDRNQIISMNGFLSQAENIEYGVPQGSVLSPILLNFFINDIHNLDDSLKIQYADDTVICYALESFAQLPLVSYNFSTIKDWLHDNNLALNVEKTKFMIFQQKGFTETLLKVHDCDNYFDAS